MDPRQRDQHNPLHQSQQLQGTPNYAATAFNYQDANSLPSQEAFNQYFTTDDGPTFHNAWDTAGMLDPELQAAAFDQSTNSHWSQQQHQSLQQGDYSNAFSRSPNPYGYPSYGGNSFSNYPSNTFDHSVTYGHNGGLNHSQYPNNSASFTASSRPMQGETVSPAVLESYPSNYGAFSNQADDSTPTPATPEDHATPVVNVEPQVPVRKSDNFYDEELAKRLAASIPIGKPQGNLLVKDKEELEKTVKSQKIASFLHIGTQNYDSDDPRVIFPRIAPRKSAKELRRAVLQEQGGRSWTAEQRPVLKKLKIKPGLPKSMRTQTQAGSVKMEVLSDSSSESSSEADDDESDFEEEDDEPSPLPSTRPTDSLKATEYDTIKTVWAKRSSMLGGTAIRTALVDFWKIVQGIRDPFKAAQTELTQAEAMKDEKRITKCQSKLMHQRQLFENVVSTTLQHGHPDIVERLGEIPQLIAAFYGFIANRFSSGDYNAQLIRDCLKLMCSCTTIDQSLFEKTKLDKVVPKLAKKGNETVKALAEELLGKVAKATAKAGTKPKEEAAQSPSSKVTVKANGLNDVVAGVKRARSSEAASLQPAKKGTPPVGTKGSIAAAKTVNGTSAKSAVGNKLGAGIKADSKASTAASSAPQPKVKHVVAKPSALLAGLSSASKKPGTSIAAQKTSQQPDIKSAKPTEVKSAAAVTKPAASFSFSQTLANLGKAKPVETVKQVVDDGPPETEEEKAKRLRKEERRKLRVKFKPGDSLTEVKLFHHDPEEEMGHDDNMKRDAASVKDEGIMLKMHKDQLMDEDDEEDVVDLDVPWHEPSEIDFNDIDYDSIIQNYTSRGGQMNVTSAEAEKQEQRQREKLIAVYASLADIPPNPNEPFDPYSGEAVVEQYLGEPTSETRARESWFNAHNKRPYSHAPPAAAPPPQATDVNALLHMLSGQAAQPPTQQVPQIPQIQQIPQLPQQTQVPSGLEAIFQQFANGQSHQAQPQAQQQQQPPQVDASILNALSVFNQQQQVQHPPQQGYNPEPAAPAAPNLAALLAQVNGGQNAPQNYGNNNNSNNNPFRENPERKRQWSNYDGGNEHHNTGSKRFKGDKPRYQGYQGVPVLPCKFYKQGKCIKGENCTFVHETS